MSSQDFAEFQSPGEKPILDNIFQVSDKWLGQLRLWLEQNPPAVPISSVLGFSQFTAKTATTILTSEATTSTSYTNLTTTGPTITGLPDGKYLVLFSCLLSATGTNSAYCNLAYNSTAADDTVTGPITTGPSQAVPGMQFAFLTLSNAGNNSVTMKYKAGATTTATFAYRNLAAIRYANP